MEQMGFVCKTFTFSYFNDATVNLIRTSCDLYASSIYDSASHFEGKPSTLTGTSRSYVVSGVKKEFVLDKDECETSWTP